MARAPSTALWPTDVWSVSAAVPGTGAPFDEFGMLRRRRAEIEYPQHPGDDVDAAEAAEAFAAATRITDAADQLVPELSLYT